MHLVSPVSTRSLGTDRAMLQNHQVPGVWTATAKFCAFGSFQKRLCARDPRVSLCAQAMRPDLTGSHLGQLFPPLSPAPYPILPGGLVCLCFEAGSKLCSSGWPKTQSPPSRIGLWRAGIPHPSKTSLDSGGCREGERVEVRRARGGGWPRERKRAE